MLLQIDLNVILTTLMLPDSNVISLCNLVGAWRPLFSFSPLSPRANQHLLAVTARSSREHYHLRKMEGEWFHENMHVPEKLKMSDVKSIKENMSISVTIKPFRCDFNFFFSAERILFCKSSSFWNAKENPFVAS